MRTARERWLRNIASQKWKKNNPEHVKLSQREYYEKHSEERKAYSRAYYATHKTDCLRGNKSWRIKNQKRRKLYFKKYNSTADRKQCNIEYTNRRRTVIKQVAIEDRSVIRQWLKSWKSKKSVRCYWCGRKSSGSKCHGDHIVPLSGGGKHAISNLCIACSKCNHSKHRKSLNEWNDQIIQPVLL